jgi:hypothetical protein
MVKWNQLRLNYWMDCHEIWHEYDKTKTHPNFIYLIFMSLITRRGKFLSRSNPESISCTIPLHCLLSCSAPHFSSTVHLRAWPCLSSGGQAVSRRLLSAAARVQAWKGSCGICSVQSDTETGFLEVLLFTLPIIPSIAPYWSSSGVGIIGQ